MGPAAMAAAVVVLYMVCSAFAAAGWGTPEPSRPTVSVCGRMSASGCGRPPSAEARTPGRRAAVAATQQVVP